MRTFVVDVMADRPLSVQPPIALVKAAHLGPIAFVRGMPELRAEYAASVIMTDRRARVVREVMAAFAARGIAAALLKGISFVGTIYPDPAQRPMHDIDLLVRVAQLPAAIEVVVALGFARVGMARKLSNHYHAIAFCRGDIMIELHRNIQQSARMRLALDEVWLRTAVDHQGTGARRLERIDELLLCMVHASRHELAVPVIHFVDVHRLWQRLTAAQREELRTRAQHYRISRSVNAALQMTELLAAGRSARPSLGPGSSLLPSTDDILMAKRPTRRHQIVQKLLLTEGPIETTGLGYAWAAAILGGWLLARRERDR